MALALAACGTLDRPTGPLRLNDPSGPVTAAMAQTSVDARVTDFTRDFGQLFSSKENGQLLALSGGGANGAYGAGLLYGWTQSGKRPDFDIVTGISTGALAAPFAFIGSDWDETLRNAYTGNESEALISLRSFSAVFNPSLFSSKQLTALVDAYVTLDLLEAVAARHATGRRLLVVTTNLDSQESVFWNMGVIAARGDEDARKMFRNILVASASIPGVFPPVLLPGRSETGQPIAEMHVDGGVNLPYLAIPEQRMLWTSADDTPIKGAFHIIVNGQAGRNFGTTPGRLTGILARTYDSMSKSSLRTHLAVTAGFAQRNGLEMSFSAIPDNIRASALAFDQASMNALFEVGRTRALDGTAWQRLDHIDQRTGLVAKNEIEAAAVPVELAVEPKPEQEPAQAEPATDPKQDERRE